MGERAHCVAGKVYYGGVPACGKPRPHQMSIGRYVKRMQDHVPLRANVIRRGDDSVEIRWNPAVADPGVTIYRGDSPDCIEMDTPVAHATDGHSVMLSELDPGRPHFFKLVAPDGAGLIVGERRPAVEGAPNLRDLGGYEAKDGRCVKWGTIFRSSNLARLTDQGIALVKQLGIRLVCDFRTEAEVARAPNRFPDSTDTGYLRLPIQHGDFEPTAVFDRIRNGDYAWISEEFMLQGYIESIERHHAVWLRFFDLLVDSQCRPLLFHCTGGKDRTGAAAALILLALGVPEETVVRDYGLSDGYNTAVRQAINDHLGSLGVDIAKVTPYFTAPESRIRALLDHINRTCGSAVDYLVKQVGISEKTIALLRDTLLE
jgi:protein-tyrosine phosphatase